MGIDGIVNIFKYTLTPHAQNRIVDKTRKMNKLDVLYNLFTKSNGITKTKNMFNLICIQTKQFIFFKHSATKRRVLLVGKSNLG